MACQNVQLLTLGCYFGLFFCNLRFDAFDVGNRGFQLLRCRPAVFRQRCLAATFTDDTLAVGVERRQSGFRLLDQTLLQGDVALCVADCGPGGGYACLGLIHLCLILGRIDLHQQLSDLDVLVILHQQAHDTPANLSADRRCVGTQIGIVGRLVGHACYPASPAKRNDDGKTDPSDNHRCAGKAEICSAPGLSCDFGGAPACP